MELTWSQPHRNLTLLDGLGLTGAVGFAVARFVPVARLPFWGCALRRATGWPCPGCGLTRVADHLAHFRFGPAWEANPLGTVAALLFALTTLFAVVHLGFRTAVPLLKLEPREARVLRWTVALLVVLNYAWVVVKTRFPGLL